MNILDINDLPILTMQISGREGVPTSALIVNQEQKNSIVATDISYVKDDKAIITITDTDFIDSIEEDTSLSIVIYDSSVPLYRDIVKFTGQLNSELSYSQYENSGDYYIYEDNE